MDNQASDSPMEDYNRLLIGQINDQLKRGFEASLQGGDFSVIRSKVANVLSVVPSAAAAGEGHEIVSGPAPFAACIQYVNAYLVTEPLRKPDKPEQIGVDSDDSELFGVDEP